MGCATVNKLHFEFDLVTSLDAEDWPGRSLVILEAAVITEVILDFESGWYQYIQSDATSVDYWTAGEIAEYGTEQFSENYQRMQEPKPWVEEPTAPKVPEYTDGYYWGVVLGDPDKFKEPWRRLEGVWSWKSTEGMWYETGYADENIEESMTFVPED